MQKRNENAAAEIHSTAALFIPYYILLHRFIIFPESFYTKHYRAYSG